MSILFFHFDGTDNEPADAFSTDESISNVLKSHLLLGGCIGEEAQSGQVQRDSSWRSFYYPGIGTYGSSLERWLNAGFAFEGADVAQILRRALIDFQCHFHSSIKCIVLIGFSRGAALARRFATLINEFLPYPMVIEAVMDTVASIGLPNLDRSERPKCEVVFEHGGQLPSKVAKALHLVALDEQRLAFRPTLMNADPRVEEVWLPGVHSDVGGGYRDDSLADLSFQLLSGWLGRHLSLRRSTLHLPLDQVKLPQQTEWDDACWQQALALTPKVAAPMHLQRRPRHYASLTLAPRSCHVMRAGRICPTTAPLWHRSVFMRMAQGYQPMAKLSRPAIGCLLI